MDWKCPYNIPSKRGVQKGFRKNLYCGYNIVTLEGLASSTLNYLSNTLSRYVIVYHVGSYIQMQATGDSQ